MNVAVIGSGGREHALCFKLKNSKKLNNLYCIPGNAGTEEIAINIKADISDFNQLHTIFLDKKGNTCYELSGPKSMKSYPLIYCFS